MSAGSHYRHHYEDMLLLDGSLYGGLLKPLTGWKRQGQSTPTTDYDGSSVDYDSSTVKFGGTGQAPASVIKQRSNWSKAPKLRTTFRRQGQVAPTNDYDGNTIDYDSSSVQFGGTGQSPTGLSSRRLTGRSGGRW
jgi:hypothetical protein